LKLRGSARRFGTLALLLLAPIFARPAHAFGPVAESALATRLARALPPAAGWTAAYDGLLALELDRRLEAETADPETFDDVHRFEAAAPAANLESAAGAAGTSGGAAAEFGSAAAALRSAFASPDPAALAAPLARLVSAACDLADPFLTSAPDAEEVAGARAAFSEDFDSAAFDSLACGVIDTVDPATGAVALAAASAAQRSLVEQAAITGDDATLSRLRAERLRASLELAVAAARRAWALSAGAPGPGFRAAPSIWPNPARGAVRVAFALAAAGPARIEVLDVTGRMRIARELGARAAGAQSVVLDAASLDALPAGTYFVRVHTREALRAVRLVRVAH